MISLWNENVSMPDFPPKEGDQTTDVLIIGGGIAGLLTAFFLHRKGIRYLLVEKNRIACGVTQNTTAKITFQHGLLYHKIEASLGDESAKKYLNANRIAFSKYRVLCQNIDCDYTVKDNYVYSLSNRKKLEKEMDTLQRIGCAAKLKEELPLPIKTAGAVCIPNQAQFHPLKFLAEISKGLNIQENTHVQEMIGNTAVTNQGKIKANQVIVATHFPFINKHGSYYLKLYQHRSYVIALANAQTLDGMYVDDDQKGLSFRSYKDLTLLGGGGHRTGKQGGNWKELRQFARHNYPQAEEKYHWATQDCMSLDSMPYIGRYSKRTQDLYVASGFNKWGMTGAMLSALMLTDMIDGKKSDYEDLFSPSRSIIKPQLAVNATEAVVNLITPTTKRCPHLGCALKWNKNERTWDCPCHGSRFDEKGKVLDNPANDDLKKKI